MTGRLPRWQPADASAKVRESPPAYAMVVTQFVTHQPGSRARLCRTALSLLM